MGRRLARALAEHRQVAEAVAALLPRVEEAAALVAEALEGGRRLFACGNGGSAADAQHLASELTGRCEAERRGYPAVALTVDASALTAVANDYGFEEVFARQLEALARPGDVLVAISTSGRSANVVRALERAGELGLRRIALLGRDGGPCAALAEVPLVVGLARTPRIQEAHVLLLHLLCEALEPEAGPCPRP
ncbi:MAG: SIS domain-containing protein [Gammaproteobacteria bacterium]|nr:MAG: SIS domain-containing protein [Gammaproteobacteria bacterium]